MKKLKGQKWKKWLWSKVYAKWLWNDFFQEYDIVLEVLNWRTARTCTKWHTNVTVVQPCFKIFGIKF